MQNWIDKARNLLDESLNSHTELDEMDWKRDVSQKKMTEHLIAMTNLKGGGFFVFGVSDNGKTMGLEDSNIDKVKNTLTNLAREAVEPKIRVEFQIDLREDKRILFVYVVESAKKPAHLRGKGIEHTFIRIGGSTRKASYEEIGNMLLYSHVITFEEIIAESFVTRKELLEEIDYKAFFDLLKLPTPTNDLKTFEELKKYKLVVEDGKKFALTNLGVLTIAKDMSKFSGHFNRGVRILRYADNSNLVSTLDLIKNRGYAIEFESLIEFIVTLLPQNEVIESALRQVVPMYPKELLREIIVNAIIHQDLKQDNYIKIEIFPNRIEVTNSGSLINGIEIKRLIDNSELRNPLFAKTMYMLHICENRGSGIDRAFTVSEIYGLPPLVFFNEKNYFKVTIYAPKSYKEMSKEERLNACYQHCALKYMKKDFMTNASLRERFKMKPSDRSVISRVIKDSVKRKDIKIGNEEIGSLKDIYYIPEWA